MLEYFVKCTFEHLLNIFSFHSTKKCKCYVCLSWTSILLNIVWLVLLFCLMHPIIFKAFLLERTSKTTRHVCLKTIVNHSTVYVQFETNSFPWSATQFLPYKCVPRRSKSWTPSFRLICYVRKYSININIYFCNDILLPKISCKENFKVR